eukprot:4930547-Pyramimonas_sp.AAC.1
MGQATLPLAARSPELLGTLNATQRSAIGSDATKMQSHAFAMQHMQHASADGHETEASTVGDAG